MMELHKLWFPRIYTSIFVFFTGILFFFFYIQEYHIPYIRPIINSNLIDQALDTIPICTLDDRARQRNLLSILLAWSQFAREQNIQYWLAYGSLIGYSQRRGFLPHDQDVDILIMNEETAKLVPFADTNSSKFDSEKYLVKVQPEWMKDGWHNRSYFRSNGIDFTAPNARFIDRKTHRHVDIYSTYTYHPFKEKNSTNRNTSMLTDYDLWYGWISLPKNWTFPLRPCLFSTLKVWCPAQPEKVVAGHYGKASTYISKVVCINGTWTNSKAYETANALP